MARLPFKVFNVFYEWLTAATSLDTLKSPRQVVLTRSSGGVRYDTWIVARRTFVSPAEITSQLPTVIFKIAVACQDLEIC